MLKHSPCITQVKSLERNCSLKKKRKYQKENLSSQLISSQNFSFFVDICNIVKHCRVALPTVADFLSALLQF